MKNYYVLTNGRVRREHNTLTVETENGPKRPLPIEDIESLYLYGEVDLNTKVLNFLAQKRIPLHVFNYYGFYAGSYYPREYLHSGFLLVQQVAHYGDPDRRMLLAREIVQGAAHGLLRNLSYYERRRGAKDDEDHVDQNAAADTAPLDDLNDLDARAREDADTDAAAAAAPQLSDPLAPASEEASWIAAATEMRGDSSDVSGPGLEGGGSLGDVRRTVTMLAADVPLAADPDALRGREGKMRERYYSAWRHILTGDWDFNRRVRRPPDNEVNALVSFGNGFLYSVCLSEIYRTQLTPTISYLHEPGARRFSLALDLSEIFKPLIVDRALFTLLNKGQLKESHFDRSLGGCFLTDAGKRLYLSALEDRLGATIHHRRLNRSVSYRHLIRLECYKLVRHLTGVEGFRAFRAWW